MRPTAYLSACVAVLACVGCDEVSVRNPVLPGQGEEVAPAPYVGKWKITSIGGLSETPSPVVVRIFQAPDGSLNLELPGVRPDSEPDTGPIVLARVHGSIIVSLKHTTNDPRFPPSYELMKLALRDGHSTIDVYGVVDAPFITAIESGALSGEIKPSWFARGSVIVKVDSPGDTVKSFLAATPAAFSSAVTATFAKVP